MADVTHIDLDHLNKYVSGDDALRDEILSIFIDQGALLREKFNVNHGDEEWEDTAHALKGASRGIGSWALGDLCEEAEKLVGPIDKKIVTREAMLEKINAALALTVAEAAALRET